MNRLIVLLLLFGAIGFSQTYIVENKNNIPTTAGGFTITLTGTGTTNVTLPTSGTLVTTAGNVATATALAANGTNCSAGQFPLGVDASGNSESCTALPTTIAGTTNQVAASAPTGTVTLSLPQSIHTAATPQFSALGLGGAAGGASTAKIYGTTSGSIVLAVAATAGANTITFPAVTGSVVTTGDTASVTNAMLAGSIDLTTKVINALPAANFPAQTGDVTNTAGSLATTVGKIGGNNVSLAGALTFSGAFASTFNVTAATTVTFPTTGTLSKCDRYTLNNNGTNWTVAVNGGSATAGIAIPAATTSSPVLFALGANEIVTGVEVKTTTAWSGTGFTSITATVGDSVASTTLYTATPFEMTTAVSNTNFLDATMFKKGTFAGSNVVAALTGNQNLNANAIAGVTDFRVCRATTP